MTEEEIAEARAEVIERLADGESLLAICEADHLPSARTVQRWQEADAEFDVAIMRARETGYFLRGERAVADAKKATDAALGRLALDAERWFLGKLSNAFSDKHKVEHSGPGGKPIETAGNLRIEGLTDEQLRALASIPVQPD